MEKLDLSRWQSRTLPIMSGILIVLVVFFCAITYFQMRDLQAKVGILPNVEIDSNIRQFLTSSSSGRDPLALMNTNFVVKAKLEVAALTNRYQMARALLIGRLWARYLGFLTGMILAFVGAGS